MSLIMDALSALEKLAVGRGSAAVLRERIELLRDHIQRLEVSEAAAKTEAKELRQQVAELRKELERREVPQEFIERRGVLFRRNESGDFGEDAYCPRCKIPMVSVHGLTPFKCGDCGRLVGFTGLEVPQILRELQSGL